ncbi:MAG: LolA family protein [Planctomycetota bacterium]
MIKKLKLKTSVELDSKINDQINALAESQKSQPAPQPNIWRIIMKSKITKLAAAAVIIITVILSITFLDKAVSPAYALEQTLEAIQNVTTMHVFGRDWGNLDFQMWIELNPETGIPDYCRAYWPETGTLDISTPEISYQYNEKANRVLVNRGKLFTIDVAPARIFEQFLQASHQEGTNIAIYHEQDPGTGQILIVVHSESPDQSFKVYVDPETKLPVRMNSFGNQTLGQVVKDIDRIEYNFDLPEGIFEFEIPEDAKVTYLDEFMKLTNDPQYGISTEGLTEQQAAEKIAAEYWNALIAMDMAAMQKVFPSEQPMMTNGNLLVELVETGGLYIEPGCGIGKILPCVLRFKNGSLKEFKIIIKFRNIDGLPSCVIAGSWSSPTTILPEPFSDPDFGLETDALTDAQAAMAITADYWDARIEGNWEYIAQLYPYFNAEQWESRYKDKESQPIEVLEIGQPLRRDDCTIGPVVPDKNYSDDEDWYPYMPVVPCSIKYSDDQIKESYMVVKIRNIDGKKSCLILGTYGGEKDSEE